MIPNFEAVRDQLKDLANVLNAYKSEAVQLRLVELIFGSVDKSIEASTKPEHDEQPSTPRRRRARRSRVEPKSNGSVDPEISSQQKARVAKTGTTRMGSRATLARLLDESFFKQPRTIGDLVTHCDTNLASRFKQSDFSGALARYVRDGKLARKKNAEKQYEYTQP